MIRVKISKFANLLANLYKEISGSDAGLKVKKTRRYMGGEVSRANVDAEVLAERNGIGNFVRENRCKSVRK